MLQALGQELPASGPHGPGLSRLDHILGRIPYVQDGAQGVFGNGLSERGGCSDALAI